MTSKESRSGSDEELLAISLDLGHLSVSYLSSLLRVVQAALREVAMSGDRTRHQFDQRPQPVLVLSGIETDGELTLLFTFVDARESTPLREPSSLTFDAFLDRFIEFVRGLPQPGLWGGAARRAPQRPFDSELTRRMDQVHRELRRSAKATVRFRDRTIEIEGDRMEFA